MFFCAAHLALAPFHPQAASKIKKPVAAKPVAAGAKPVKAAPSASMIAAVKAKAKEQKAAFKAKAAVGGGAKHAGKGR